MTERMGDNVVAVRIWRRIDEHPGLEHCRLLRDGIEGDVVVDHCFFSYRVVVDAAWRTQSVRVDGWAGAERFTFAFDLPAVALPALGGCVDADLGFTPSTNTLPIRRLGLAIGEEARVSAAWLRYPGLTLERLEQTYRRTGEFTWQYTSATGFTGALEVDEHGLVRTYEGGGLQGEGLVERERLLIELHRPRIPRRW